MPLFDFICSDCGEQSEILITSSSASPDCRSCGSSNLKKLLSIPSSLSGVGKPAMSEAGPACCGMNPGEAGCSGPGSCCGKAMA
jgi:putative FmdB family regulatory protein